MIRIISFGYGHSEPPKADFTLDVRDSLRNPFDDESLREKNAFDPAVLAHVQNTPGARTLVRKIADLAISFHNVLGINFMARDVTIAVGCAGGRHRAPALAMLLEDRIASHGIETEIEHRDIHRALVLVERAETESTPPVRKYRRV